MDNWCKGARDVGSVSNLGGHDTSRHFFLKKKGAFSKIRRAPLCLLQNLGGHVPPVPPGSYVYERCKYTIDVFHVKGKSLRSN